MIRSCSSYCAEYVYGEDIPPAGRYINGKLAAEYQWSPAESGVFLLITCKDYVQGLDFHFSYAHRHCPETLTIRKLSSIADRVWEEISVGHGDSVKLLCGCDQVGSLKRLTDEKGNEIKYTNFDSFGNVVKETLPDLRLPLGFASGLWDHESGLVRFGCRDYDPYIGRFLCPDPMGETGGDQDPYDYCVDNPVSRFDPDGLWARESFKEYMVSRDAAGKFAPNSSNGEPSEQQPIKAETTKGNGADDAKSEKAENYLREITKRSLKSTQAGRMAYRISGAQALDNMRSAAWAADMISGVMTGEYGDKAQRGFDNALDTIAEKLPEAIGKVGEGIADIPNRIKQRRK